MRRREDTDAYRIFDFYCSACLYLSGISHFYVAADHRHPVPYVRRQLAGTYRHQDVRQRQQPFAAGHPILCHRGQHHYEGSHHRQAGQLCRCSRWLAARRSWSCERAYLHDLWRHSGQRLRRCCSHWRHADPCHGKAGIRQRLFCGSHRRLLHAVAHHSAQHRHDPVFLLYRGARGTSVHGCTGARHSFGTPADGCCVSGIPAAQI